MLPSGAATPLARTTSRLPVLDETCALEHARTTDGTAGPHSSASSAGSQDEHQEKPGRLRKASLAIQKTLGLGGSKDGAADGSRPTTPGGMRAGNQEYSANMVDVLDTLGITSPASN